MKLAIGIVAAVAVLAAPQRAAAQESEAAWFVGGLAGATFGTEGSAAIAARGGVRVAPNLFVIGEVGRIGDVMPRSLQEDLDEIIGDVENELGGAVDLEFSIPATYGFGGIRFVQPRDRFRLFVEGGVGLGHVSLSLDKAEFLGVDVTDELETFLESGDVSETKLLLAAGGGVNLPVGSRLTVDVGYRFMRIAAGDTSVGVDSPSIHTSVVYAAVNFWP